MMCTTICTPAKAMIVSAVTVLLAMTPDHHQPEGDGRQDDGQAEADQIASQRAMRVIVVMRMSGVIDMGVKAHRSTPRR